MSEHFVWKPEYNFNIAVIDKQHKYFVSIINELYSAILSLETRSRLKEIFTKLTDYAVEHFATEEKYFVEFNYEGAKEHKLKHDELKAKIAELQDQLSMDKLELSFDLIDFLESWLVDHLAVMDAKYVACFKNHGL
jgi:hemerythrin-like metal-binding protein